MVLGAELPARGVWSFLLAGCWVEVPWTARRASAYMYTHACRVMHVFKSHAFVLMPSAPRRSSAFPAVCVCYLAALGGAGSFIAAFGDSGSGLVAGLVAPGPVGS